MKRKRRAGEVTCWCGAYKFPHRMMGGDCNGAHFVQGVFDTQVWGDCRDCPNYEQRECEIVCTVLDGREAVYTCPALDDKIRFEGIKLYGVNRPPPKGSIRFRR